MKKTFTYLILLLVGFSILLAGCEPMVVEQGEEEGGDNVSTLSGDVKKAESYDELVEYLGKTSLQRDYYGGFYNKGMMMERSVSGAVAMDTAEESSDGGAGYSETNVQVEGVDEADIIKTDGEYIYVLSQKKFLIVEAGEDAKIVSKTLFEGQPEEIFISDEKVIVFVRENKEVTKVSPYDFVPREQWVPITKAYVYDTTVKDDPEVLETYELDGNYYDARMINGTIYFISVEYLGYWDVAPMPEVRTSQKIMSPDIFYFPQMYNPDSYMTVASFSVEGSEELNAKTFVVSGSDTMYMSKDNIYIAYAKDYEGEDRMEVFEEVILPLLPNDVSSEIRGILSSDMEESEQAQEIAQALNEMYSSMSESEVRELVKEIEEAMEEHYMELEQERRKTVIHRIAIDDGEIEYAAQGEVEGYLLNQFSLDENEGYLRVATTTTLYTGRDTTMYNNVFVLDEEMDVVGELEDIAEDERIYSSRFIGDKLYLVTFRQIDPFFVIDLSDPERPEVMGELKIPGYSTYLHPFNETLMIGIGKDTKELDKDRVVDDGLKVSLFDVSDFENPKEVDSYIIEGRYSDSLALHEHKAFLLDKNRGILVLPVSENDDDEYRYDSGYWQGAYVLEIGDGGIELRGKVEHEDNDKEYWYSSSVVKRSLYIEDILYTISEEKIVLSDIESVDEIGEVDLGYMREESPIIYY